MSLPLVSWAQNYRLGPMTASGNTQKAAIDGLYYELQQSGSTKTATVTYEKKDENGMYRSSYAGDVVIPEKVKYKGRTYKVESVGMGAFANCLELTTVTLPSGVGAIGDIAFAECRRLRSFKTLGKISNLGSNAFQNCTSLTGIDFDRIEWAAKDAFDGCTSFSEDDTAKWNAMLEKQKEKMKTLGVPEESAEFPGDVYAWIAEHIQYPKNCQKQGIQGRIAVQFMIEKDGSITDAKALRGPDEELKKEAERLVLSMPKWKPAMQGGEPVRMRYVLPIVFHLP